MKTLVNLVLLLLFSVSVPAASISGSILDKKTRQPIAYVNVGVPGKGIGTVTDVKGRFSLLLPDSVCQDMLRVSCIGYVSQSFGISALLARPAEREFLLEENVVTLSQVVIRPKAYKTKVLGNTNNSKMAIAGFESNDLGSELGTIMKIKKAPSIIEKVNFNIANNPLDSVIFRLNIYTMKDGQPDSILLKEPVYVTFYERSGTLSVDLKKYTLVTSSDFFVSLEWIRDYGLNKIYFCAGLMDSNSMSRKTSQATWQKLALGGVGFNATVSYEK